MILLTERELAKRLAVSQRTLQTQRQTGHGIPFIKVGKCVRYRLEDVEQYLSDRRYLSTAGAANTREG
jgi:DNA binding domain, excisionase family